MRYLEMKYVYYLNSFLHFRFQPIQLLQIELELAAAGKMPSGTTQIPFEAPLKAKPNRTLFETYHGVFVNVQYNLKCELKRSQYFNILSKDLQKINEFIIETKVGIKLYCLINSLINVKKKKKNTSLTKSFTDFS